MANWATKALLGDPSNPNWQIANLTDIEPVAGQRWKVYRPAAQAFSGLISDLAAEGYPVQSSGGFNYRNIRGSDTLSQHAFGTAIDLNAATNPLGGQSTMPANVGELAAKHGLEWGGNWKTRPDPMHFEYAGNTTTNPVPQSGRAALMAPPESGSGGQQALLPPLLQPPASGDGYSMASMLGEGFKPMRDAMTAFNQGYSADRFMSDMLGGGNPMRNLVFSALGSLFRA